MALTAKGEAAKTVRGMAGSWLELEWCLPALLWAQQMCKGHFFPELRGGTIICGVLTWRAPSAEIQRWAGVSDCPKECSCVLVELRSRSTGRAGSGFGELFSSRALCCQGMLHLPKL